MQGAGVLGCRGGVSVILLTGGRAGGRVVTYNYAHLFQHGLDGLTRRWLLEAVVKVLCRNLHVGLHTSLRHLHLE